jgi:phage-related protein
MFYKLILSVFPLIFLSSCNTSFLKDDLSSILGMEKVEIENNQTLDDWAGNQGEGFILEVYELSEKTVQTFINQSSKRLPDKKEKVKNWQKYDWRIVPVDSSFNEVFIMCLNYSSDNQKLKTQLDEIKLLIKNEKVYYSFYYRPDKENPQNAQLFILDTKSRKFYAIDQQI